MLNYLFSPRFLIFLLLATSIPYWLVLRSWYGFRFLRILIFATVLSVPCIVFVLSLMYSFIPAPEIYGAIVGTALMMTPVAVIAAGIQIILLAFVNTVCIRAGLAVKPDPGYAGSFILWPGILPRLPVDAVLVAAVACLLATGHLDIEIVRRSILSVNGFLEQFGIWTLPVSNTPDFNLTFAVIAVPYVVLVLWTFANNGVLPLHDEDVQLDLKRQQKPTEPLITPM